ncbi:MAG: SdpI family protein [Candidatus Thermoplasmatota archaeon]|nr:SdpI family protein [Candidatus Thermoplasmatota archaeon]
MDNYVLIILLYILVGLLEIIMGIPLLLEKVKPNWFYGFRLPKTLSNNEVWYKSNKYVGRDFVIMGIIISLISLFMLIARDSLSIILIVYVGAALLIGSVFIVLIRGFIYLKKL